MRLLGNCAGYGYSVMGPTGHALEDCAILLTLPGMPACNEYVAAAVGPIAGSTVAALAELGATDPALWVGSELSLAAAPPLAALVAQITATRQLCVIGEHEGQGGVGAMLAT